MNAYNSTQKLGYAESMLCRNRAIYKLGYSELGYSETRLLNVGQAVSSLG